MNNCRNYSFLLLLWWLMLSASHLKAYPTERRRIIYYSLPPGKNPTTVDPSKIASIISPFLKERTSTTPVSPKKESRARDLPKGQSIIIFYQNSDSFPSVKSKNFQDLFSRFLTRQFSNKMMMIVPTSQVATTTPTTPTTTTTNPAITTENITSRPAITEASTTSTIVTTSTSTSTSTTVAPKKDNATLNDPAPASSILKPVSFLNDTNENKVEKVNQTDATTVKIANTTFFVSPPTTQAPYTRNKNLTSVQYSISTYSVSSSDDSESRTYSFEPKQLPSRPKIRDPGYIIFTALNSNATDELRPVYRGEKDDPRQETQTSISVSISQLDDSSSTPSPKTYLVIEDFQGEKLTRKTTKKTDPSDQSQTQTSHQSKKSVAGTIKNLRHSNYHVTNYTYVADETVADRRMSSSDSDAKMSGTEFLPLTDVGFFNPFPVFNADGDSSEGEGGYRDFPPERPGPYYHASEARDKGLGVLGSGNFEVVKGGIYKEEEGSENNIRYHRAHPESFNHHGYRDDDSQFDFGPFQFRLFNALSERRPVRVPPANNRRLRFGSSQLIPTTADLLAMA